MDNHSQWSYHFIDSCSLTAQHLNAKSDDFLLTVLYWMVMCLIFALGNTSALLVIHYERFGGDWQKRGLNNRLYTRINFAILVLNNTIIILCILVETEVSAPFLYIFLSKIVRASALSLLTFVAINILVMFWQAFVWLSIKDMNDHLLDNAITASTCGISLTWSFMLPINPGNVKKIA